MCTDMCADICPDMCKGMGARHANMWHQSDLSSKEAGAALTEEVVVRHMNRHVSRHAGRYARSRVHGHARRRGHRTCAQDRRADTWAGM